jgi:hypothetical protein
MNAAGPPGTAITLPATTRKSRHITARSATGTILPQIQKRRNRIPADRTRTGHRPSWRCIKLTGLRAYRLRSREPASHTSYVLLTIG